MTTIRDFVARPLFDRHILLARDPAFPKISIVTPSYNQAQYLERTVLSVLNQNYPNLEYFVFDGGSTDGSVGIIRKYEAYLAGWVSDKDNGQTAAINKGLQRASGDFVAWQNSDDIYLPGTFQRLVEVSCRFPRADLYYANIYEIDANENIIGEYRNTPATARSLFYDLITQQAAFMRRAVIERFGLLDESLHFSLDAEYFMRISSGVTPAFVREYWGAYRVHSQTKTTTIPHVMDREYSGVFRRYGIEMTSPWFKFVKLLYTLRRAGLLIAQGDAGFVMRQIVRRFVRRREKAPPAP